MRQKYCITSHHIFSQNLGYCLKMWERRTSNKSAVQSHIKSTISIPYSQGVATDSYTRCNPKGFLSSHGLKPGTFCLLDTHVNHYTMETRWFWRARVGNFLQFGGFYMEWPCFFSSVSKIMLHLSSCSGGLSSIVLTLCTLCSGQEKRLTSVNNVMLMAPVNCFD